MNIKTDPSVWLRDFFADTGLGYNMSSALSMIIILVSIAIISWLANLIAKTIILRVVTRIVKKSETQWDDIFLEQKVFTRLSHFAPALVIWFMSGWALKAFPGWLSIIHSLTSIYMLSVGMIITISFIESWHIIYQLQPIAKDRSIKGYVQLVKVLVVLVTVLIIISVVFKKEVSTLIAGLGVMASVLILVFRDTLVGVISSIQLSSNKMVKVGDWITIPKREVDGIVTDINLSTVKIQNFDMTIVTVPPYSLVQDSFQNWSGMEEAGVRRIKRSLYIDIKSIKFLDDDLRKRLVRIPEINEYIEKSEKSGPTDKSAQDDSPFFKYNKITNLMLFRFYGDTWLKNHPDAANGQVTILRNRVQTESGLPLEVVVFSKDTSLQGYEKLQNEVFEHLYAVIKDFDLKVFQQPTGDDLLAITGKNRTNGLTNIPE
jgi:miniconductance mechanosensitive channel